MNKKYILIGAISALVISGAAYAYHQYKLIDKLCFNVTGYKIASVSSSGVIIDLNLAVKNLGGLNVKVNSFSFDIYADNKFLAKASSDEILNIQPRDIGTTTVRIKLNPKDLLQNVGSVLQGNISNKGWKNIKLSISGGLNVKKGILPFYIPVKYDFRLSEYTEGEDVESPC